MFIKRRVRYRFDGQKDRSDKVRGLLYLTLMRDIISDTNKRSIYKRLTKGIYCIYDGKNIKKNLPASFTGKFSAFDSSEVSVALANRLGHCDPMSNAIAAGVRVALS